VNEVMRILLSSVPTRGRPPALVDRQDPGENPSAVMMRRVNVLVVVAMALFGAVGPASGQAPTREDARPVDVRYRSPRATARTFLVAMNLSEDHPSKIDDAVSCLDLSGVSQERRESGRLAFELEFILRSTNIPTGIIPDHVEGSECEIGEGTAIRLKLHKVADGRWLFDSKTLEDLPRMRLKLWQQAVAATKPHDTLEVASDFRSPFALLQTFFDARKKGDLDTAAKCFDLSEVPSPARRVLGRGLAIKLKEVLDRTVFVILQDAPDTSAGVPLEAVVRKEGRITAERQSSGDRKGQWLLNRVTVRSLDPLYNAVEFQPILPELAAIGRSGSGPPFRVSPGLWLRRRMPQALRGRFDLAGLVTLSTYQILGLVLVIGLSVPVYRCVTWVLDFTLRAALKRRGVDVEEREIRSSIRPVGWAVVVAMIVRSITLLDLPLEMAGSLLLFLMPVLWGLVTLALYVLIDPCLRIATGPVLNRPGATAFAAMGYPVLALVLKLVVIAWGLAAVLSLFEYDVATVLAGLGIGGIAFALAAQDTLKNFFGSVMLIADRTFRVGDLVQIGSNEGVVESVGLRTTRIRGLDDSLLTIPNGDLTTTHITNYGARRYRRYRTQVTVPFDTPRERLIGFRDAIRKLIESHPGVRHEAYEVALNDIGNSGIEIVVQVFLDVPDRAAEIAAREKLILAILQLGDELGIAPLGMRKPLPAND
jgi:MscS family membrane protein